MTFVHLIQSASSLPIDASTLQSAISALERDITALESSSVPWERSLPWFTALVALGVAMELWVIWRDRRKDTEAWRRGTILSPERPSTRKLVVEIMGVLLVTGGIVGELWVGVKITSINGSLRTKSGELRSKSDQLLALVTQQSGEARNSADAANKSAGRAQYKANAVSNQTDKMTQELTKDEQGISELEAKRAELEKSLVNLAVCNAPRVIPFWSVKTKTSVDPLKLFGGRQAIIEFVPDAETRRAALSIYGSLDRAGWKIIRISPLDGIEDGVEIQPYTAPTPTSEPSAEWYPLWRSEIRSDDAADALVDFLHSYDWQAKRGWPVDEKGQVIRDPKILPPDTLRIRVGLYPAVIYVSPPGAKDFADFIAKGDQQREAFKKQMDKELADRNEEVLKHLTPQQASEYKARTDQMNKEREQLIDRMAGPCQPLNSLTPSLR